MRSTRAALRLGCAARLLGGSARLLSCAALAAVSCFGCASTPRDVHEPRVYPDVKIAASAFTLELVDSRPAPSSPGVRQLVLPGDFEALALGRLTRLTGAQGPALEVTTFVAGAGADEIVDARGEMTSVSVKLDFEVKVQGGPLLRRAHSESVSDLPRDEATPEELSRLLRSTSLDAFDRYWADAKTLAALNVDLGGYAKQQQK